jgi:hypothetical protein
MSETPLLKGREAIWYLIRKCKQFSIIDLENESYEDKSTDSQAPETIRGYVKALTKANILEAIPKGEGFSARQYWKLIDDKGLIAPRVNAQGKLLPETAHQQMWRAIRILKTFTIDTLIASISTKTKVTVTNTQAYVSALYKAGYLTAAKPANPSQRTTYKLKPTKNTGPKPPRLYHVKNLYDPNLNQVVWTNQEDKQC